MTDELLHLFLRQTDDAVYATSSQLPGFMYGRGTLKELRADLEDALAFHTGKAGPFRVLEHHERHYDIADGELVTRIAMDEHAAERQKVYRRLDSVLRKPQQAESLAHGLTNTVGEAVYVCALPSDTMGWLMAQLDEREDALYAAVTIADHMLLTLPFAYGERYVGEEGTFTLADSAYTADTPLSEIIQSTNVVTPVPRREGAITLPRLE